MFKRIMDEKEEGEKRDKRNEGEKENKRSETVSRRDCEKRWK